MQYVFECLHFDSYTRERECVCLWVYVWKVCDRPSGKFKTNSRRLITSVIQTLTSVSLYLSACFVLVLCRHRRYVWVVFGDRKWECSQQKKGKKVCYLNLRSLMGVILCLHLLWSPLQLHGTRRQLTEIRGAVGVFREVGVLQPQSRNRNRNRNHYSLLSGITVRWPSSVCGEHKWCNFSATLL